ncbi:Indole-3-acetaldehyde oxidase [Bienertia sinuspersici]
MIANQSLNPAVDLGRIEGAFVQGIGFFMLEQDLSNPDGLVVTDSTWTYKIPKIDTIPRQLNVEFLNSGHHQNRVLSSKAMTTTLNLAYNITRATNLLAASVQCATITAIQEARKQLASWDGLDENEDIVSFQLSVPATMLVVKELCGLNIIEKYLNDSIACRSN